MDESAWISLREPWERVRWARMRWQAESNSAQTARAAAESLGMGENTYSAYERPPTGSKNTGLTHDRAIQFGRKFKVSWVWLLTGDETPFSRTPAQVRAIEAMKDLPENLQEQVAGAVEGMIAQMRKAG